MPSILRIAALGAIILLPAQASADQLAPGSLDIVNLGSVSATTCYTEEPDGFRVVTTIQEDGRDAPVPARFIATLQPGQRTVVSVPAQRGVKAWGSNWCGRGIGSSPIIQPNNARPPRS
jgi:hypothetical protein